MERFVGHFSHASPTRSAIGSWGRPPDRPLGRWAWRSGGRLHWPAATPHCRQPLLGVSGFHDRPPSRDRLLAILPVPAMPNEALRQDVVHPFERTCFRFPDTTSSPAAYARTSQGSRLLPLAGLHICTSTERDSLGTDTRSTGRNGLPGASPPQHQTRLGPRPPDRPRQTHRRPPPRRRTLPGAVREPRRRRAEDRAAV